MSGGGNGDRKPSPKRSDESKGGAAARIRFSPRTYDSYAQCVSSPHDQATKPETGQASQGSYGSSNVVRQNPCYDRGHAAPGPRGHIRGGGHGGSHGRGGGHGGSHGRGGGHGRGHGRGRGRGQGFGAQDGRSHQDRGGRGKTNWGPPKESAGSKKQQTQLEKNPEMYVLGQAVVNASVFDADTTEHKQHVAEVMEAMESLCRALKKRKGQEAQVFGEWCAAHARDLFPNIGTVAYAVPSYFTGRCNLVEYSCQNPATSQATPSNTSPRVSQQDWECRRPRRLKSKTCKGKQSQSTKNPGIVPEECRAQQFMVITAKLQDSDLRGERAQRCVGRALRIFNAELQTRGEKTMFIISQLHLDNMLAWLRRKPKTLTRSQQKVHAEVCSSQAAMVTLPDPADRCEMDLMVIHQNKGVVLIEVKSVCRAADRPQNLEEEIKKGIEKALQQLKEDEKLFNTVMDKSRSPGEKTPPCQVTKVIAVPCLTRDICEKVVAGIKKAKGIVLLCKDDLFQNQDCQNPDVAEMETNVQPLVDWWEKRIPDQKEPMKDELMQEIVGKYVGLLSTVTDFLAGNEHHRLRHLRDCVRHTSSMFQQQVLNKSQLQALGTPKERPVRAHFSGPPGSGKTLLLVLEARTFLADSADHQVVVLNMYRGAEGRAIGKQIYRNIKGSSGSEFENRVFHLQFDVNGGGDFDAEVNNLLGPVARKEEIPMHNLMFVVDEIYVADFWKQILVSFDHGFAACHVLTAGLFSSAPPGFAELELEVVHRCPPSVQNLLFHVDWKEERRRHYVRDTGIPEVATNGPTPLCIRHQLHVAGDGSLVSVTECCKCAEELATLLKNEKLVHAVKAQLGGATASTCPAGCTPTKTLIVTVLVNIPRKMYETTGEYTEISHESYKHYMDYIARCPFIQTLQRGEGIDVVIKKELACKDLIDEDQQKQHMATWIYNFQGLETSVVIFLPGDTPRDGEPTGEERHLAECGDEPTYVQGSPASKADTEAKETSVGTQQRSPSPVQAVAPSPAQISVSAEGPRDDKRKSPLPNAAEGEGVGPGHADANGTGLAEGVVAPKREIPTPGLNTKGRLLAFEPVRKKDGQSDFSAEAAGGDGVWSITPRYWKLKDIDRFSAWDKTNIMVAGSRCLSLLILVVP